MDYAASRCLVLSRDFEPCSIIGWQQAVTLYYSGKCEILESYEGDLHSPSTTLKIPAVVRLVKPFKRFFKPLKFSRTNVYTRDEYRCCYCGQKFKPNDLTYDHVLPRSQGGETRWDNIVSCCDRDNAKKAGRTPQQAGMKLLKEPYQPKGYHRFATEINTEMVPASWLQYIVR